jgi:hypothetical protein
MPQKLLGTAVIGRRLILVICSLADLEAIQAERVDLGQHALQHRPV